MFASSPPSLLRFSTPPTDDARSRSLRASATAGSYAPASTAPPVPASSSLYDVLGLSAAATCHEIKAAYRRLARACHPDVVAVDRKDASADKFMRIHAAYSTLSDPEKRADYDRNLLIRRRLAPPYASRPYPFGGGGGGLSRRTWETDQCW